VRAFGLNTATAPASRSLQFDFEGTKIEICPEPTMPRRILEIGHLGFAKERFPDETLHINTEFAVLSTLSTVSKLRAVWTQARSLLAAAWQQNFDLVICRCFGRFIYRRDISFPVNLLRWFMGWMIRACVWLQVAKGARLAVVDALDESTITSADLFLLKRCTRYFKRELPQNTWNTFLRVQPSHGEFNDLISNPRFVPLASRFAPIGLGVPLNRFRVIDEPSRRPLPDDEKLYDLFYAGTVRHSTVRQNGLEQLIELRARGWRIEIMTGHIAFEEYLEKIRRSWLAWSPEGQGWDCYRHYEACLAGSVPLINYPTIQRHQPLLDDVHCIFYPVEGDGLCRRAEAALADKPKLRRMSAAARAHVLNFHTNGRLGDYLVTETMQVPRNPN
jgi:hypothetical protein